MHFIHFKYALSTDESMMNNKLLLHDAIANSLRRKNKRSVLLMKEYKRKLKKTGSTGYIESLTEFDIPEKEKQIIFRI